MLKQRLIGMAACLGLSLAVWAQDAIDLAGSWQFEIDRNDVGTNERWFDRDLADHIILPGSMPEHGKGDDVGTETRWIGSLYDSSYFFNPYMEPYRRQGNIKFPFFLTPEKHYVGTAWYRRSIYVPQTWEDRRVVLFLERPHIETTVYVNGQKAGHQNSLSAPHEFDITDQIVAGQRNHIAIRVYNGIDGVGVGQDSHSVSDQTQGDWNGIVGRMELRTTPRQIWIEHVYVYPNVEEREVEVEVQLASRLRYIGHMPVIGVFIQSHNSDTPLIDEQLPYKGGPLRFTVRMNKQMETWDEFHPNLYRLTVTADDDIYETNFGMRDITTQGRQIMLNGRPIFLRGTVENCCFPLTGYPPTDEEAWEEVFRKCKEYGLNFMRFHSYCPPEAAFNAADRLGFYLQPEGPTWPNHGVKLGQGMPIDKYLMDETQRIIDTYGNHPSFVMMASGNEPAGNWVKYTNHWVNHWKREDPRRLYCGASVGGGWAWDDQSQYHVKGGGRGLDWSRHAPSSDDNYLTDILRPRNYKGTEDNNTPIIAHEQGQWCAFPDLKETRLYRGVYKARNFEIFADLLRDNGMEAMAEKFLMASGKLQTLCYKYEIERNLRTPDYSGFQLLALNDYSGQGTALEGVLNVFWKEKGYCTAKEWSQFCAPVVPLARFPKFVYSSADTLRVPIEIYNAHYGKLTNVEPLCTISDTQGKVLYHSTLPRRDIPLGKNTELGTVTLPLAAYNEPTKLTLTVAVANNIVNSWEFWVYPEHIDMPKTNGLFITSTLDDQARKVLAQGGKVLITAAGKVTYGNDVRQTYLPVFWNTSWFKMRPPHTTGAYINTEHPLFHHFPSDNWGNLNWWELLNRAQVMNLGRLPKDYQSPVQPIDTWHLSRKLGMIVEAQVGKGRLFMTTMDIDRNLDQRLVARQMRQAILRYMLSDEFKPTLKLSADEIDVFFTTEAPQVNMFTKDSPDELKPKLKQDH